MRLGDVAPVSKEKGNPLDQPDASYIGLEHIEKDIGSIISQGVASEVRSTKAVFRRGDLLYGKLRPYLNKVWIAEFDGLCSTDILVFSQTEDTENKFLKYRFMASDFVRYATENSSGVNLPRVNAKVLAKFPLFMPEALTEQHRIVAEIEKQFARLDAGVDGLKRVQANLKRYRATVLKAACEGKLVEKKSKWKRTTLGEVLSDIEAGRSFKCDERPPQTDEVGVVKVSAVTWGTYDEMKSKTCGDESRIEERFYVRLDDFLFSRANTIELIGACVIAKKITLRVMLSDKILRFSFVPTTNPSWILYWLRSSFGRSEIRRLATGNQDSMRNIGQNRIRQITLLLPPLAEQKRIVEEVERRLSVIEEMEAAVAANLKRAARLRQSILKKAFEGGLDLSSPCGEERA